MAVVGHEGSEFVRTPKARHDFVAQRLEVAMRQTISVYRTAVAVTSLLAAFVAANIATSGLSAGAAAASTSTAASAPASSGTPWG